MAQWTLKGQFGAKGVHRQMSYGGIIRLTLLRTLDWEGKLLNAKKPKVKLCSLRSIKCWDDTDFACIIMVT